MADVCPSLLPFRMQRARVSVAHSGLRDTVPTQEAKIALLNHRIVLCGLTHKPSVRLVEGCASRVGVTLIWEGSAAFADTENLYAQTLIYGHLNFLSVAEGGSSSKHATVLWWAALIYLEPSTHHSQPSSWLGVLDSAG
ncbi:hypothetical protein F5X96DRAFT_667775 [Biscogniauxia mediterranea]|nr:hypothetical protein F5X96DRAFT_667775 [Biscogniauxia mediterranea]